MKWTSMVLVKAQPRWAEAFRPETAGSCVLTTRMIARSVLTLLHWLDSLQTGA
jgi:hypothetical protein